MKLRIGMHGNRHDQRQEHPRQGVLRTRSLRRHRERLNELTSIRRHRHGRYPRDATGRSIPSDWRVNSRSICARSTADASGLMDEMDFQGGDIVDFHGVKMLWAGDMTGAEMMAQMKNAYSPSLIYRNTNWIWHAGTPVHLLREPGGAVWVMQEFTKDVDPSLDPRQPRPGGQQAEEPAERLDVRDQGAHQEPFAGYGSRRRLGCDHPRRAALHLPGLRLRRGHQCQLRAVTRRRGCRTDQESQPRSRCERPVVRRCIRRDRPRLRLGSVGPGSRAKGPPVRRSA